jgi:hypothetical protein
VGVGEGAEGGEEFGGFGEVGGATGEEEGEEETQG